MNKMGSEALLLLLLCATVLAIIAVASFFQRRRLRKQESPGCVSHIDEVMIDGQRAFRIATVCRESEGRLALDVYEIRLPRANDSGSTTATVRRLPSSVSPRRFNTNVELPPPPFSTAVNMPSPAPEESTQPPHYHEVIMATPNVSMQSSAKTFPNSQEEDRSISCSTISHIPKPRNIV